MSVNTRYQFSAKVGGNILVIGGDTAQEFEHNFKELFGDAGWAIMLSDFETRVRRMDEQSPEQQQETFQQAQQAVQDGFGVAPGLASSPPQQFQQQQQQYQNPYPQQGGHQQPQQQASPVIGNDPMTGAPITYHPDGKYGPYYKVPGGGPGGKDLLANVPKWDRGKPASQELALKAIQNRRDWLASQGQM